MNIGIDIVYIPNFVVQIENTNKQNQIFTSTELAQNQSKEYLAGIFAAKETFFKALGRKINWQEVWIEKDSRLKRIVLERPFCILQF